MNARFRAVVMLLCAALLCGLAVIFRPLPLPQPDARALEFVDRNGLVLGTILSRDGAHTASVPLAQIAGPFVDAIVAAEDARFFEHGPLDARAAVRALVAAIRRGQSPRGASTISMQLARLMHPLPASVRGRLEEIVIASRLESGHSKREILEAYCNRVPMGGNLYGVEAAALAYFGVHARDLDVAQSALLAGIPNDPARLEPRGHWRAARARQRGVLAAMVSAGRLSAGEAREAAAEHLALRRPGAGIVAAPHALFALVARVPSGVTVAATTLDRPLQQFVEAQTRAVVAGLGTHRVRDAAALVVENRTGDVLAYAGSPDYFSDSALGRNDGVQALRQPGSALKPFLYELALERRRIRPNSIILDAPISYAIRDGQLYEPVDYAGRFLGPVRIRAALANSLNVPAVRVLERIGVGVFLERLRRLGFAHLRRPAGHYGLGLALGSGEVSLYELTRAYATMARGGRAARLNLLAPSGAARYGDAPVDPAWALVTDILADRHARATAFGVDSILALPFPSAVKTGTSSDFRDTWTVGFTRDYTVGVWVGNFDGTPMHDISGVTGAGPLWNRIMLHLAERAEPPSFTAPPGYRRVAICARTGGRPAPACRSVVTEWLDSADLAALRAAPVRTGRPPPSFGIASPHDGDRFVMLPSAGDQRIDVALSQPNGARSSVTVDGIAAARVGAAFTWRLRPGLHVILARCGRSVARVRIAVERAAPPRYAGFTDVPGSRGS